MAAKLVALLLGASLPIYLGSGADQQEVEAVFGSHGDIHSTKRDDEAAGGVMRREEIGRHGQESAEQSGHPVRELDGVLEEGGQDAQPADDGEKPKTSADGDGAAGPPGPKGKAPKPMAGPVGLAGIKGNPGLQGDAGAKGPPGFPGGPVPGPAGPIGAPGHQGAVGDTGPQGQIGPQGMQGPTWDGVANAAAMINFASNLLDKVKAVENIDDDRTEQLVKRVDQTEKELGLDTSTIEADADEDNEINQLLNQGSNLVKQVSNMNQGTSAVVAHQKAEADAMADEVEAAKRQAHNLEAEQKKNGAKGLQSCLAIVLAAAFMSVQSL